VIAPLSTRLHPEGNQKVARINYATTQPWRNQKTTVLISFTTPQNSMNRNFGAFVATYRESRFDAAAPEIQRIISSLYYTCE
jgi:hypothetical protein